MNHKTIALLILLGGVLLFCLGNNQRDFVGFECRFGFFAKEMMVRGPSFFPTVYGQPYPDYPATQTILIYLLAKLWGKVTIFTAILPTAICAALTLMLTYLIGALHSRRLGLYAVAFLLVTVGFVAYARSPSLDHFITTITALCFYLVYSADVYQVPGRWWSLPGALLAGLALRGPMGLVIPAGVVWGYYLATGQYRRWLYFSLYATALLVAGSLALLYGAYLDGGPSFVSRVMHYQVLGRFAHSRGAPWYYYLTRSLGAYTLSLPGFLLVLAAYYQRLHHSNTDELTHLLKLLALWILIILVGLSIPATKKMRYLLPVVPALALGAAYIFLDVPYVTWLKQVRGWLLRVCQALPWIVLLMVALCLLALQLVVPQDVWASKQFILARQIYPALFTLLLWAIILIMASQALLRKLEPGQLREGILLSIGLICYLSVQLLVVEPLKLGLEATSPLIRQVQTCRHQSAVVFYRLGPDGPDVKYMVNLPRMTYPRFCSKPRELLQCDPRSPIITSTQEYRRLPPTILQNSHKLFRGKIGHKECVVFTMRGG